MAGERRKTPRRTSIPIRRPCSMSGWCPLDPTRVDRAHLSRNFRFPPLSEKRASPRVPGGKSPGLRPVSRPRFRKIVKLIPRIGERLLLPNPVPLQPRSFAQERAARIVDIHPLRVVFQPSPSLSGTGEHLPAGVGDPQRKGDSGLFPAQEQGSGILVPFRYPSEGLVLSPASSFPPFQGLVLFQQQPDQAFPAEDKELPVVFLIIQKMALDHGVSFDQLLRQLVPSRLLLPPAHPDPQFVFFLPVKKPVFDRQSPAARGTRNAVEFPRTYGVFQLRVMLGKNIFVNVPGGCFSAAAPDLILGLQCHGCLPKKRCRQRSVSSTGTLGNPYLSRLFGYQESIFLGILLSYKVVLGNHGMNALRVVDELGDMQVDGLGTEGIAFQLGDAVIPVQELDRLLHGHLAGLVQISMESHHDPVTGT